MKYFKLFIMFSILQFLFQESFEPLEESSLYAKDKNRVYYAGEVVAGANPETFWMHCGTGFRILALHSAGADNHNRKQKDET